METPAEKWWAKVMRNKAENERREAAAAEAAKSQWQADQAAAHEKYQRLRILREMRYGGVSADFDPETMVLTETGLVLPKLKANLKMPMLPDQEDAA